MTDREEMTAAIRKAVFEALYSVSLDVIRSGEFFGTNQPTPSEGEE